MQKQCRQSQQPVAAIDPITRGLKEKLYYEVASGDYIVAAIDPITRGLKVMVS